VVENYVVENHDYLTLDATYELLPPMHESCNGLLVYQTV
jgi:hypothetical protein